MSRYESWSDQLDRHEHNAEIASVLRADRKVEEAVRATELRDVRIATFVEATRLTCDFCEVGYPFIMREAPRRVVHSGNLTDATWGCAASAILLTLWEMWA